MNESRQRKFRDSKDEQGSRLGIKKEWIETGSIGHDKEVQRSKVSHGSTKSDRRIKYKAAMYKTSLCKHFISGYCRYASACVFAHGVEDLCANVKGREGPIINTVQNYKQVCGVIINPRARDGKMRGRDGQRSQYNPEKYKTAVCKHHLRGSCWRGQECNFAHGYDELRIRECVPNKMTKESKDRVNAIMPKRMYNRQEQDVSNQESQIDAELMEEIQRYLLGRKMAEAKEMNSDDPDKEYLEYLEDVNESIVE